MAQEKHILKLKILHKLLDAIRIIIDGPGFRRFPAFAKSRQIQSNHLNCVIPQGFSQSNKYVTVYSPSPPMQTEQRSPLSAPRQEDFCIPQGEHQSLHPCIIRLPRMNSTLRNLLLSALTALITSVLVLKVAGTPESGVSDRTSEQLPPLLTDTGAAEEPQIVAAVKRAEPAVVSVIVSKDLPIVEQYYESPFGDQDLFGLPFNFQIPRSREIGTERREIGGGTAFFISSDGLLMTNRHVVADEEADYTVLLNDGRKLEAEVVARDTGNDIALLKAKGRDFPALSFAEGDSVALGQTVIAIGNALGEFRNTVSVGVISGLSRTIT